MDAPPPIPNPAPAAPATPVANSFARKAARFSLFAPLIAFGIGITSGPLVRGNPIATIGMGLVSMLLVLSGLVLGIVALVSTRRHGKAGILGRAVTGTIINGVLSVIMLFAFTAIVNVVRERATEAQLAKGFVALLQDQEHEFFNSMKPVLVNRSQSNIDTALGRFAILEQRFQALRTESAKAKEFQPILTKYEGALREWKDGLMLLKEPNPDTDRVQKMFKLGDKFRGEAVNEFDSLYSPKQQQPEK